MVLTLHFAVLSAAFEKIRIECDVNFFRRHTSDEDARTCRKCPARCCYCGQFIIL